MQALKRAKFAVGVHAVHMDNDRIRVDEDEDENGVELNVMISTQLKATKATTMLLFAGTGQNRIVSSSNVNI